MERIRGRADPGGRHRRRVREAANRDQLSSDRVRLRTGIEVEVIDGSREPLTYLAVQEVLDDTTSCTGGRVFGGDRRRKRESPC